MGDYDGEFDGFVVRMVLIVYRIGSSLRDMDLISCGTQRRSHLESSITDP